MAAMPWPSPRGDATVTTPASPPPPDPPRARRAHSGLPWYGLPWYGLPWYGLPWQQCRPYHGLRPARDGLRVLEGVRAESFLSESFPSRFPLSESSLSESSLSESSFSQSSLSFLSLGTCSLHLDEPLLRCQCYTVLHARTHARTHTHTHLVHDEPLLRHHHRLHPPQPRVPAAPARAPRMSYVHI